MKALIPGEYDVLDELNRLRAEIVELKKELAKKSNKFFTK